MQSVCVLYVQKAKKSSSDTFVPLRIRWMFIFVVDAQGLSTNSRLLWRVVNSLKEPTREFHRAIKSRARIFPPFDWSIDCHPVSSYRISCQGFYRADPNFSRVSVLRGEMLNSIDSPLRVARENRNRKVRHWSSLSFVIFMAQKRIFFEDSGAHLAVMISLWTEKTERHHQRKKIFVSRPFIYYSLLPPFSADRQTFFMWRQHDFYWSEKCSSNDNIAQYFQ